MEGKIEQYKDNHHAQRNQYLQPCLCTNLVLPLSRPCHIITRWQLKLLFQNLFGLCYKAAHIATTNVKIDQRTQQPSLTVDLRCTGRQLQLRHQRQGNLASLHTAHQNTPDRVNVITEVAQVSDADRKAVASFNRGGEHLTAESSLYDILNITHTDPVACCCLTINIDVQVVAAGNPFSHHISRSVDRLENCFSLNGKILQHIQVIAEYLYSEVSPHSGREHVDAVDYRLCPTVAHPCLLQL